MVFNGAAAMVDGERQLYGTSGGGERGSRNRNRGTEQPVLFILECRLSELSAGLFIERS